jgi:hypothetical protein
MLDTSRANAIRKAVAQGTASQVRRVRFGLYRVPSATEEGVAYTVRVDEQGNYSCNCPAGTAGRPCYHKAGVYIAKVEHASKGRVTAPSAAPPN